MEDVQNKQVIQGLNKETILGMLRSKTINVNTLLTLAIVALANTYGIPLTPVEAATLIPLLYGVVNIILRFFTKKSLPEKGIKIPNPIEVQNLAEALSENPEALEKLYNAIAKWKNDKIKSQKFSKAMEMKKE